MLNRRIMVKAAAIGCSAFMLVNSLSSGSAMASSIHPAVVDEDAVSNPDPSGETQPTQIPETPIPTEIPEPTEVPTEIPTQMPTEELTETLTPTEIPTEEPTEEPTETPTPTPSEFAVEKPGMKVYKKKSGSYYRVVLENNGILKFTSDAYVYTSNRTRVSDYSATQLRLPAGEYLITDIEDLDFTADTGYCEVEFNNTFDAANAVQLNTTYQGSLSDYYSEDSDYYKFTLSEQSCVSLDFTSLDEDAEYNLSIYEEASNGNTNKLQGVSTEGTNNRTGKLRLPAGTYFVVISKRGYSRANYDIGYSFQVVKETAASGNYETEPNNSEETANVISLGTQYIGNIQSSSDKDYYKADIPYNAKVYFTLTIPRQTKNSMFRVELTSEDDYGYSRTKTYLYSDTNPVNTSKEVELEPGTYYLKITSGSYSSDAANIDYKIQLDAKELKPLKSIDLSSNKREMNVGDKVQLNVAFNPSDADDTRVKYKSDDSSIIKISNTGMMEALAEGKATITVTSKADDDIEKELTITVKSKSTHVNKKEEEEKEGITYSVETVDIGDTINLDFNYDDDDLKFSSSNSNIAKVSRDGTVTFKKSGKVTIKVITSDGTVDRYQYRVNPKASSDCSIKKVKASKGKVKKYSGGKYKITLSQKQECTKIIVVPNHKKAKVVIDNWYDDGKTVYLDRKENVTLKVKVTAENGKAKTYKIKVERK